MWADGVFSVSSMLWVMMPARCGGVWGKPPAGAAGIVGGMTPIPWNRTAGLVSYAPPKGLLMLVDMPKAKPWSKFSARPCPMRSKTLV